MTDTDIPNAARLLAGLLRGARAANWRCVVRQWPDKSAWPIARLWDGESELLLTYAETEQGVRLGWRRGRAWARTSLIPLHGLGTDSAAELQFKVRLELLASEMRAQESPL
jgi:hypothetical protein